jgi:uncharacterized membrane protein
MIWIILIYLISVIMFLNILIKECKEDNIPIKYETMFGYYGVDLIWIIIPLINTVIVLLWCGIKILDKFTDKFKV